MSGNSQRLELKGTNISRVDRGRNPQLLATLVSEPSANASASSWDSRCAFSKGQISNSSSWDLLARFSARRTFDTHDSKVKTHAAIQLAYTGKQLASTPCWRGSTTACPCNTFQAARMEHNRVDNLPCLTGRVSRDLPPSSFLVTIKNHEEAFQNGHLTLCRPKQGKKWQNVAIPIKGTQRGLSYSRYKCTQLSHQR